MPGQGYIYYTFNIQNTWTGIHIFYILYSEYLDRGTYIIHFIYIIPRQGYIYYTFYIQNTWTGVHILYILYTEYLDRGTYIIYFIYRIPGQGYIYYTNIYISIQTYILYTEYLDMGTYFRQIYSFQFKHTFLQNLT